MPKVTINNVRIHYLQAGQGPDLVMMQGLAADLSFWYLRIVPRLTDRWRVTVYDQRGQGFSDLPPSGYTTADLAKELRGLLDHLGIERPHIAAHSFGGAVALHHAILEPDRVRSLALFDCRIPALQPLPPYEDGPYWRERREALQARGVEVTEDTPKILYSLIEDTLDQAKERDTEEKPSSGFVPWRPGSRMARRWQRLRLETTLPSDMRQIGGLDERAIARVDHPTLLSFGARSRSLATCWALEKSLPNHETLIHPGLGHFFPAVKPEVVTEDLREFLDELERQEKCAAS